jgi:hypothetical protein
MRNTYHRCELKEFWIKNGFLDPKEGVIRLTPPDELTEDYFCHVIVEPGPDPKDEK